MDNDIQSAKEKKWDVFISHASEDKEDFVRPLAQALTQLGVKVWYDEFSLEVGASLSRSIDDGLVNSRYGIVVISSAFIQKKWPERELKGLVAREIEEEQKVILPIWLGITKQEVLSFSPPLADTIAIRTEAMDAQEIALLLLKTIRPDIYKQHPRAELEKMLTGEALEELQDELEFVKDELAQYRCIYCEAPLSERAYLPEDPELYGAEMVESFECGHTLLDGVTSTPCTLDPNFPKLDEFEIHIKEFPDELWRYQATFIPNTKNARRLSFGYQMGRTEKEAEQKLIDRYEERAKPWHG